MSTTRLAGALFAASLGVVLLSPPAQSAGGDLIWYFQGVEDVYAIDDIEDMNGDLVPDVVVESYDAGATGDHLYCLSGASSGVASVIWSTKPAGGLSSGGGYDVECLRVGPDITGDGKQDVFLGTAWGGRSAYVIHGPTGDVSYHFDTYYDTPPPVPTSGWVYTIKPVPDVDSDGVDDMFFACGSDNDGAYHISLGDGIVLWWQYMGDAVITSAVLDDVNGDGVSDGVFGVGDTAPKVRCMAGGGGPAGTILWTNIMTNTVHAVERIADVNGDGVNDVLAGIWNATGTVYCFDGVGGGTIWSAPVGSYAYIMHLAALDDVDGDGFEDVAVGSFDNKAVVLSGRDGSVIWSATVGTLNGGDVWKVGRVEDVTGDGVNDVVAGSFDYHVYLFDGATGDSVWVYNTGHRLYFVDGVTDISGNGVPDVVAGSQMLTAGPPGGRAYLLEGGESVSTGVAEASFVVRAALTVGGVRVSLAGRDLGEAVHVERVVENAEAAEAFKRDLMEAHKAGALTAEEVVTARRLTPGPEWVRLTESPVPVSSGGAEYLDRTALPGVTYSYRFVLVSPDGGETLTPTATVTLPGRSPGLRAAKLTARPNPVNPSTVIEFTLPEPGPAKLRVFGANGREVASLLDSPRESGAVRVEWDGRDDGGRPVPSGVYFLRLETAGYASTGKVTVLR
ncbi:MAG: FlgD immunoglobulin-like domain containing protein [Candidatus Eisenbacteria bacterium]